MAVSMAPRYASTCWRTSRSDSPSFGCTAASSEMGVRGAFCEIDAASSAATSRLDMRISLPHDRVGADDLRLLPREVAYRGVVHEPEHEELGAVAASDLVAVEALHLGGRLARRQRRASQARCPGGPRRAEV